MQPNFIAIELSPLDAELFVLFQKHYQQFKEMIKEEVFEIKGGSAIIDFDDGGNVDRVIRQLYSKKKPTKLDNTLS